MVMDFMNIVALIIPLSDAYKAFVATVAEALKNGEEVALAGFGTFKVKNKAARKGINPQTKQVITIPATKAPSFKFGKKNKRFDR